MSTAVSATPRERAWIQAGSACLNPFVAGGFSGMFWTSDRLDRSGGIERSVLGRATVVSWALFVLPIIASTVSHYLAYKEDKKSVGQAVAGVSMDTAAASVSIAAGWFAGWLPWLLPYYFFSAPIFLFPGSTALAHGISASARIGVTLGLAYLMARGTDTLTSKSGSEEPSPASRSTKPPV